MIVTLALIVLTLLVGFQFLCIGTLVKRCEGLEAVVINHRDNLQAYSAHMFEFLTPLYESVRSLEEKMDECPDCGQSEEDGDCFEIEVDFSPEPEDGSQYGGS